MISLFKKTLCLLVFTACANMPLFAGEPSVQKALTPAEIVFEKAKETRDQGDLLGARELCYRILKEYSQDPVSTQAQKELENLNIQVILSPTKVTESVDYEVKPGDSLDKIARKFQTTIELIKKRNHLTKDMIHPRQKLSIWKGHFRIFVSKGRNLLYLIMDNKTVKTYPVSTGKSETTTPVGEFTIVYRYPNPVWYHRGVVVPPGTPDNFLGTRWLGFDKPRYGIHGTVEPELIGQSVSGGCVRMRNEDVEELYDLIPIGTSVVIGD